MSRLKWIPNYGNLTLNSLLKIASAFDIGLLVKFVPFSRLLLEFQDLSPQALSVESFTKELAMLKKWAIYSHNAKESLITSEAVYGGNLVTLQEKDRKEDGQILENLQHLVETPRCTNAMPFLSYRTKKTTATGINSPSPMLNEMVTQRSGHIGPVRDVSTMSAVLDGSHFESKSMTGSATFPGQRVLEDTYLHSACALKDAVLLATA